MNEKKKDSILSIAASLLCIAIGLLVGLIILYCINAENAWNGFTRIIQGGFYLRPKGIGSEISQAAPLIRTVHRWHFWRTVQCHYPAYAMVSLSADSDGMRSCMGCVSWIF